ncbi:MAG: hypothetical protein QXP27_08335 [Candidatus Methanomethyliaceae archaeon]
MADELVKRGEIDSWYDVAEYLPKALDVAGLSHMDLGRVPHYTDAPLVAVTLSKHPYLLYWDAEVRLREPHNWIEPSIELLLKDDRIFCVNPNWLPLGVDEETLYHQGDFAMSYGFSDQLFLVRPSEFAKSIYQYRCLASLRYPLSHIIPTFEQRVDSYARYHRRLRATYLGATYIHPNEGASYPSLTLRENVKKRVNKLILRCLSLIPTNNPCFKINPKRLEKHVFE